MTPAGRRDRKISIEINNGAAENSLGEPVEGWTANGQPQPMARIIYGSGEERRQAAAEGASQSATFNILATPRTRAIKPGTHRISYDGQTWDIAASVPMGRREIDLVATRRA